MQFRTELSQILDIIVHSLYSQKEIFLRELISNAVDAIEKVRFASLTDPSLLEEGGDWEIRLGVDKEKRALTVSDNGIGMNAENIVETLGTIARSGTQEFLQALKAAKAEERPQLIGQFGVGFYSAFMVADRVVVTTRMSGHDAVQWESEGKSKFTVRPAQREKRGTDVVLHLQEDAADFLEPWRLRQIVKQYSDFVEHPIVLDGETLNSRKALWLRPPHEVKPDEYAEFYKQLSRDSEPPLHTVHFAAEGTLEFRALLFLPKHRPMDWLWHEPKVGLSLYIQRVFILDDSEELLPLYLRFVKGVVDSSDLPLNVSREMLQSDKTLEKIRKGLVAKLLRSLEEMQEKEIGKYREFFDEFGTVLKEGVAQDAENKQRIAKLLLFESSAAPAGERMSLQDLVDKLPPEQERLWYLTGETRGQLENSPYLESIRAKEQHVLFLTDPIDEFVVGALREFEGKELRALDKGELPDGASVDESEKQRFQPLFDALLARLHGVKEIRLSTRLRNSAAVLVAPEHAFSAHFERLLRRSGRADELPPSDRVLELNGKHPAVQTLLRLHEANAQDPRLEDYAKLLYDQALIAEGSRIEDPAAFAQRINQLIARGAENAS